MGESAWNYCPKCAAVLSESLIGGVLRPVCPACQFVVFVDPKVVVVVVVEHQEKILLGKRNIAPKKGMWSFFGGYVDRGEQVEEAARREVKEECNLDVQIERLVGVYSEAGGMHILIVYQASVVGGLSDMVAQPEEVSELAFYERDKLPQLAFAVDYQILKDM